MKTNRLRNYSAGILWQKYISLLLAAFVFVLGMLVGRTADAAKITADDVSRTVTIQPRLSSNEKKTAPIKMRVMIENIDLKAYEKYTVELRKNAKYANVVFAKAAPGSQVSITVEPVAIPGVLKKPAKTYNCSESVKYYNKKVETLKELTSLGKENGHGKNYTIPKGVELVTAAVSLTYHVGIEVGKDMKSSIGTYHREPELSRHYYIFTSDAACKKAYDLMTASSVTGAISNVFGGDKKSSVKSDSKQAGNTNDSKDSDGLGTAVKIGIGVIVLGAIGFGAYQLFGKGRGSGGKGAGNYNNLASGSPPMQRPGAPTPNSYGQQPMQRPGAPMPNSYGSQQTQRPGTTMNNTGRPQPKQRPGAATRNASGQQPAQRPGGAAKRSAAENVTYCKQCGAPMRSGSHFCKNCGARNTSNICPGCGAKLEPGDMFCGNCGMKV